MILAALVAVMCAVVTTTSQAQPGEPEPRSLKWRGTDLARQTWYASAELGPDASPEQVEKSATRTTPTITVRAQPGGSAVLFTLINVTQEPPAGAVVTIGDVDGFDETFFNGRKIGETSGTGVTDFGIPRVYYIDKDLIRRGLNVLAVRLCSATGGDSFGLRREPLTFGFVPRAPQRHEHVSADPRRGETGIARKAAEAAIESLDPATTDTPPLRRKRPSFGRFGEFLVNGLPAVTEISPTHIAQRHAPRVDVALDAAHAVSVAAGENEPGLDGWHLLARVEGTIRQQAVRYTMLQHVMYPGGILTLEDGKALQLRVSFGGAKGALHVLGAAKDDPVVAYAEEAGVAALIAFESRAEAVPVVVATANGALNATLASTHFDVTVTRGGGEGPTKVYVFYPTGLRPVNLSAEPASFGAAAGLVEPGREPAETLQRWLQLGLNEPAATDEYFRVLPGAGKVRIYQVVRHATPAKAAPGAPLLVLPPQVSFAMSTFRYPVDAPATTETGVLCFSGPLLAVDEASTPPGAPARVARPAKSGVAAGLSVVTYDLPLPPMTERGLLAVPDRENLTALLNAHLTDLATTSTINGVDAFYKSRTQGFQAFSYLTEGNRRKLLENTALIVPLALRESRWYETVEPLSGLAYWWTYFIEGPFFLRYDQDWGNGLSLYGLNTCAKYTGDWELVARNWAAVERMFSWFSTTDDWEWMRASNGQHGHGTGAGDCMSATYAGTLAYAKMARNTGRLEEADHGLYAAARAALLALNRFSYNDFADQYKFKEDQSVVLGFHEGRGFLVGELNRYPWNVTSNISGNGVQPENFDLYVKYAPDALRRYAQVFERAYPNWYDGSHKYPRPTLYRDHSGYITLPQIYLRARLETVGFDALAGFIDKARSNTYLWWLAPTVVAEVLNYRNPVLVTDWGRCAFLGGRVDSDGNQRKIELRLDNKYPPDTVELTLPRKPSAVELNGGPVPLTDTRFENGRQWLRLRRPGANTVTIWF